MMVKRHIRYLTPCQWAVLFVVVPLWVIQVRYMIRALQGPDEWSVWRHIDFSHYYATAERVRNGTAEVYCALFTEEETVERGLWTGGITEPTNTPLLTLALAPLAYVPLFQSWLIYTLVGVASCLLALWTVMDKSDGLSSMNSKMRLLMVIAASPPMLSLFHFSQVQGFLLALIVCAWALAPKHQALSGIIVGITVALKIYTMPLLAFLFVCRRYRMLLFAVAAASIGTVLPQMIDGRLNIAQFITCGSSHVSTWAIQSSVTQSIPSLPRSIAYLILIPQELADIDTIKRTAYYGGFFLWMVVGLLTGLVFRKRDDLQLGLLVTVALSIACAPFAWPHYYLLIWPYLIQQWTRLSLGSRFILWFSCPLWPRYIVESGNSDWLSLISSVSASLLVWLPGTIFIVQFLLILHSCTIRGRQ